MRLLLRVGNYVAPVEGVLPHLSSEINQCVFISTGRRNTLSIPVTSEHDILNKRFMSSKLCDVVSNIYQHIFEVRKSFL